jgi:PAS domain S-box-containing protein
MHGYTADELVSKNLSIFHTKVQMKNVTRLKEQLKQKGSYVAEEVWHKRIDNTVFPALMNGSLIRDEEGKPLFMAATAVDITERTKMQSKLQESEERYRQLVEMSPDTIAVHSEGKIVFINAAGAKLLGAEDAEELVGRPIMDFLHPNHIEIVKERIQLIGEGKGAPLVEEKFIRLDGTDVDVEVAAIPFTHQGKPATIAIVRDITERKKAEERIRLSEEKHRNLFENARDLIITTDLEGNITSANRMAEEYGYDQSGIIGKNWFNLAPKEYLQHFRDGFSKLAHGKQNEGEIEIFSRRRQDYVTVEYRSNPIIQDNKVVGIQVIVRDITERKKMEEKLRQYSEHLEEIVQERTEELLESKKRYSVVVEEASDGVVILQDGKIVFTNERNAEIVGYPKNELIGISYEKLLDEKYLQVAQERYEQRLQGQKAPTTYEMELKAKTGQLVPVEVSVTVIQYQGHPAILVIVRDVRERKRLEEQRLKLEKLAAIGELATMVAHDLRNPLTSIRNAGFYIKNSCPARATGECKTALEMLDIIDQEIIFANNIINDLLDFAAKRPLQKKKRNINNLIDDSLKRIHTPENIRIERKYAKKAIAAIDEKQLERAFLNLTKNAVQAMPNGGTLTIATNETKDHIEIAFTDTGTGIQEENMNKLFSPLFTTKAKGIGMGLAICKKMAERHGGTIEAQSKAGQGTTFTIKVPKKEETNAQ